MSSPTKIADTVSMFAAGDPNETRRAHVGNALHGYTLERAHDAIARGLFAEAEALAAVNSAEIFLSRYVRDVSAKPMSDRAYIASQVLAGFAADESCEDPKVAAREAVRWADALLAELEREPER